MKRTLLICLFLLLIPLTANAQKTLQDAAQATGNGSDLVINVGAQQTNGVTAQVSGTFSGTITWRATVDGTNFIDVQGTNLTTGVTATTATAAGLYSFLLPRVSTFRAPITTYGSGSITVVAAAAVGVARSSSGSGTISSATTNQLAIYTAAQTVGGDSDLTFSTDTLTVTKLVIGAGSPITSSGAGGTLGSNAFTSTAFAPIASPIFTGTPSGPSYTLTGTGGLGFEGYPTQSSAPSAPASGFREYADSSGRKSWIRASDGFTRTWDATLTGNRIYTLPDANSSFPVYGATITYTGPTAARTVTYPDSNFTVARTDAGQTFTATQAFGIITSTPAANATAFTSTTSNTGSGATSGVVFNHTLNTSGSPDVFALRVTDTARGASTKLFNIYGGASGATSEFSVDPSGNITLAGQVNIGSLSNAISVSSSLLSLANGAVFVADSSSVGLRIFNGYPLQFGTDTDISRISAGLIGVGTGASGSFAGSLKLTDVIPTRNILLGASTAPSANNTAVIVFADNVSKPTLAGTLPTAFYNKGGEQYVQDSAGNESLISPHDLLTNEWIFKSCNERLNKCIKVNMEQLVHAIEQLSGKKFSTEWRPNDSQALNLYLDSGGNRNHQYLRHANGR